MDRPCGSLGRVGGERYAWAWGSLLPSTGVGWLVGMEKARRSHLGGEDEDCGHTGLTGLAGGGMAQLREDPAMGSQAGRRQWGRVPRPKAKRTPKARRHAHGARQMHQPC
jgi:hypothetical protein